MRLALGVIAVIFISSSYAAVFEVSVGLNGRPGRCAGILSFQPASIRVEPGDEVNFILYGDHVSLTQTQFDSPCQPINSGSSQSISFPAAGSKEDAVRLVFGPDYDGSPLRFLHGEEDLCSPETIFTVNSPPPIKVPSTNRPPPHCSHPPPQLTLRATTQGPIMATSRHGRDATDAVPVTSTNVPPIPTFTSQTAIPNDEPAADAPALPTTTSGEPAADAPVFPSTTPDEPSADAPVLPSTTPGEPAADAPASPTNTPDEPVATSTLTVAILPHTTLVTERVIPRQSSRTFSDGTGLPLEPSSTIVPGSVDVPNSSSAQGIVTVSPLLLLLSPFFWIALTGNLCSI